MIHVQRFDVCYQGLVVSVLMEISDLVAPYLQVGRVRG